MHVTQSTGGVQTSLLLLFRHLDRTRFSCDLACPPGTRLAEEASKLGVRVFPTRMVRSVNPIRDIAGVLALRSLIRTEQYALVHAHSAKAGYLARLAAGLAHRPPVFYHPRAFSYLSQRRPARTFFRQLERLAVPLTDTVVATSESERRRAIAEIGFSPDRVVVIPNSVDETESIHAATRSTDRRLVLTVGRLTHQKNPEMFIRMAKRVLSRVPDARFVLAGAGFAGPLEGRVRRLEQRLGLGSALQILDWTEKQRILELMAECAVFVLTSRFEGMPNTVLEAMLMSKPVVVTDVDGSRDVVIPEVTGFVVAPNDDLGMAERVLGLLEDPDLRASMGRAGRRLISERFDIRANAKALERLYTARLSTLPRIHGGYPRNM